MRRVSAFLPRYLPIMLGTPIVLAVMVALWIFSAPLALWIRLALKEEYLLAFGLPAGCLMLFALIWLPKWQAASVQDVKDRLTIENATRQTLAQIIGGTVLIAGLFFTWSNLEVSREGQVTERFTKAIDQLGAVHDKGEKQLEIRLGGIYALERIARDSERDHWPVMEILTAYVRERAPSPKSPQNTPSPQDPPSPKGDSAAAQGQPPPKLAADIQAILTVLGRRHRSYEKDDQHLCLHSADGKDNREKPPCPPPTRRTPCRGWRCLRSRRGVRAFRNARWKTPKTWCSQAAKPARSGGNRRGGINS